MTYPESVSFDVRVTCAPDDMPRVVKYLESESATRALRYDVDFLRPDTLPYGDVTDLLGD
jgi:hypothetical protein